jgi:general secretion pathway protein A
MAPAKRSPATPDVADTTMYEQFYGLRERPFSLVPDPQFLLMTRQHDMALTMLRYGLASQAMISVLTGEVGSGKTTLVRHLLASLDEDVTVGLVNCTPERSASLMQWIALALNLPSRAVDAAALYRELTDFLVAEYATGRRVLLILDEAQNLSPARLEELRVLTNLNTDKHLVLQLVLVGQPELREKLRRDRLRQFAQRVGVDYHLKALRREETGAYVAHRLETAGGKPDLIADDALDVVHEHSGGVPRLINQLCDMALVYGFADQKTCIERDILVQVAQDRVAGGIFRSATNPPAEAVRESSGNR